MRCRCLGLFFLFLGSSFLFAEDVWLCKRSAKNSAPSVVQTDFTNHAPAWMLEQIRNDLVPFMKSGISKKGLDDLIQFQEEVNHSHLLVRFKIQDQQIFSDHSSIDNPAVLERVSIIKNALSKLAKVVKIPDVDFIITMHDSLNDVHFPVPIFAFANDPTSSSNIILVPDFEALSGNEGFLRHVDKGNKHYSWEAKVNQVIWRGAMTGGVFTPANFLEYPRTKAISCSLQFPDLVNARYTALTQCIDCEQIRSQYSSYFDQPMPVDQQIFYKYQLLIDGNSAAYSRAYWQLFSNCVMVKQESNAIQWYSHAIQPWVHYVPVQRDLNDLVDAVQWLIHHDDKAKAISLAAREFAQQNLSHFHVLQYLYLLLREYAKLQC